MHKVNEIINELPERDRAYARRYVGASVAADHAYSQYLSWNPELVGMSMYEHPCGADRYAMLQAFEQTMLALDEMESYLRCDYGYKWVDSLHNAIDYDIFNFPV